MRKPLVRIGADGFVGRLQALDGDAFHLAGLDDALFVRGDALRGFGDPLDDLVRSPTGFSETSIRCQGTQGCPLLLTFHRGADLARATGITRISSSSVPA